MGQKMYAEAKRGTSSKLSLQNCRKNILIFSLIIVKKLQRSCHWKDFPLNYSLPSDRILIS
jgi:hypothetical protein